MERNYTFLVDPAERPQAELGSGFIQSYLGGGTISKGFVVVSQRRAYFKGKSYFKDFKGRWKKQMQEKTVDLKDITGTGYTSMRQLWAMIAAIVSLAWVPLGYIVDDLLSHGIYPLFHGFVWSLYLLFGIVPAVAFLAVWHFKRSTLFSIEFAGGSISFNTSWYGKEEVDNFQKNLRKAMATVKDSEPLAPAAVAVHAYTAPTTGAAKEKADALREYAKLKEDGIISDAEFQQMKAELVGGKK